MRAPAHAEHALRRAAFVHLATSQQGQPYLHGGHGQRHRGVRVFDGPGLATWCAWRLGGVDLRAAPSLEALWLELAEPRAPRLGDLAFFGTVGVGLWLGGGRVVCAHGGDASTVTLEDAQRHGARVLVLDGCSAREDFRGFRDVDPLLADGRIPL